METTNQAQNVKKDFEQGAKNVKDKVTSAAGEAGDNAKEFIESAVKNVKEKTAEYQDEVLDYIKANPVKSVGLSVLAGYVLALCLRKQ